jgi:hypothetical protein
MLCGRRIWRCLVVPEGEAWVIGPAWLGAEGRI